MLHKFTSFITLFSFVFQLTLPVYANLESVEDPRIAEYERVFGALPLPAQARLEVTDNTAAGVMLVARHEGRSLVLMGKRDDCPQWCTMGGAAESGKHASLLAAARDECAEETAGMYALHEEDLRLSPCHTIIRDGDGPSFATYIRSVDYVPARAIARLVAKAEDSHQREYVRFAWVDIARILSGDLTPTRSGQTVISSAAVIDVADVEEGEDSLPLGAGAAAAAERGYHVTWNADGSHEVSLNGLVRGFGSDSVLVAPNADRDRALRRAFAGNVVNKMMFQARFASDVVRFRRERLFGFDPLVEDEEVADAGSVVGAPGAPAAALSARGDADKPATLALGPECPSIKLLQKTLGPNYVDDDLHENVRRYLAGVNVTEKMQARGLMVYGDEEISFFERRIQDEQKCWEQGAVSLYHGATGNIGALYPVFSMLFTMLDGRAYDPSGGEGAPLTRVRGNDIAFGHLMRKLEAAESGALPVETIRDHFEGRSAYDRERVDTRICGNWALPAGMGVSLSTSSSVEYFLKSHSVRAARAEEIFRIATRLLGIEIPYDALVGHFLRAYGPESDANGVLAQIVLPLSDVYRYIHAEWVPEGMPRDIAYHFRALYAEDDTVEESAAASRDACGTSSGDEGPALSQVPLVPEAWFYPMPGVRLDHPRTRLYRRHEIDARACESLYSGLGATIRWALVDLVASPHGLVPGAYHSLGMGGDVQSDVPRLLKMAQLAEQVVYGSISPRESSEYALQSIVAMGDVDAFVSLVGSQEHFQDMVEADPEKYFRIAISQGYMSMARTVLDGWLPGRRIYASDQTMSLLSPEDFRRCFVKYILTYDEDDPKREHLSWLLDHIELDAFSRSVFRDHLGSMMGTFTHALRWFKIFGEEALAAFLQRVNTIASAVPSSDDWEVDDAVRKKLGPLLNAVFDNPDLRKQYYLEKYLTSLGSRGLGCFFFELGVDPEIDINGFPLGYYLSASPGMADQETTFCFGDTELWRNEAFIHGLRSHADFVPDYFAFRACMGLRVRGNFGRNPDGSCSYSYSPWLTRSEEILWKKISSAMPIVGIYNDHEREVYQDYVRLVTNYVRLTQDLESFEEEEDLHGPMGFLLRQEREQLRERAARAYEEYVERTINFITTFKLKGVYSALLSVSDSELCRNACELLDTRLKARREEICEVARAGDVTRMLELLPDADDQTQCDAFMWALSSDLELSELRQVSHRVAPALNKFVGKGPIHTSKSLIDPDARSLYSCEFYQDSRLFNRFLSVVTSETFERFACDSISIKDPYHYIQPATYKTLCDTLFHSGLSPLSHAKQSFYILVLHSTDVTWCVDHPDFLYSVDPFGSGAPIGLQWIASGLWGGPLKGGDLILSTYPDLLDCRLPNGDTGISYLISEFEETPTAIVSLRKLVSRIAGDRYEPYFEEFAARRRETKERLQAAHRRVYSEPPVFDWGCLGAVSVDRADSLNCTLLGLHKGLTHEEVEDVKQRRVAQRVVDDLIRRALQLRDERRIVASGGAAGGGY